MPALHSNIVLGRLLLCASSGVAILFFADPAHATEIEAGFYSPGSGGERELVVGAEVVAGLDANIVADFAAAAGVPSSDAGGSVGLAPPLVLAQSTEQPQLAESAQPVEPAQADSSPQIETQALPPAAGSGEIVVTGRRASPGDPLQELNAQSFEVTQTFDKTIVAPVAFAYKDIMPRPIRSGLRNFLKNLSEPIVFLNFMLQLKPGKAAETVGRFAINTTLGAAGLIDVAKRQPFNLPYRRNGFANTLGYYGVKPGPYFYLPLIGSTTLRDFIGNRLDLLILPTVLGRRFNRPKFLIPVAVIGELDHRIEFDDELKEIRATGDPYVAARTYYLQKRQAEIDALHGRGDAAKEVTAPAR
jgi:phospholipid-binding lipoprotein MlaA